MRNSDWSSDVCSSDLMAGKPGYTEEELSLAIAAEPEHVRRAVEQLIFNGLLIETASKHVQLVPAVDLGSVTLSRLWMLARTGDGLPTTHGALAGHARALIEQAEADFEKRHAATTVRTSLSTTGRHCARQTRTYGTRSTERVATGDRRLHKKN